MIDVDALKERVDLVDLAGHDTALRKVAAAEWAGPCPRCGGDDRFHVTALWWFCRQCSERRGDAIAYVVWRDNVTFGEACAALGADPGPQGEAHRTPRAPAHRPAAPTPTVTPPDAWQDRARAFVAYAQGELWADPQALAYLQGRGLADATIRDAGMGYNPKALKVAGDRWGLSGTVWIPAGWVIPCAAGDGLAYVKIRQEAGARGPKYLCVKGSAKRGIIYGLGGIGGHSDVILCEGEYNALILGQAMAGAAAVVSVGDAGNAPGPQALAILATVRRWWLAYDPDKAGADGADKLAQAYARARPLAWPWAGDVNDAHLAGEDLAAWAVGQIGPADPDARRAWAEAHLWRLEGAAFDAGIDDTVPAWRVWAAMLASYKGKAAPMS